MPLNDFFCIFAELFNFEIYTSVWCCYHDGVDFYADAAVSGYAVDDDHIFIPDLLKMLLLIPVLQMVKHS